jgi:hypothetical protein
VRYEKNAMQLTIADAPAVESRLSRRGKIPIVRRVW